MNKETFRNFLNVPQTLPHNYRVKLEQDLILVPLFNSEAMSSFKEFLSALVPSHLIDHNIHPEYYNKILSFVLKPYVSRVNPLISIAFDKKHELNDTLIKLLYRFQDQKAIDSFLNNWWDHKKNFVTVLSSYEGWSDNNFSLKVSGSTSNGIDYEVGTELFASFVRRYRYWRQYGIYKKENNHSLLDTLRHVISEAFRIIILDNIKIPQTRDALSSLPYHTLSGDMMSYKSSLFIAEHLKQFPVTSNVDGKYIDLFAQKYGVKFQDLNSLFFFEQLLIRNSYLEYTFLNSYKPLCLSDDTDMLLSSLFVYLRANKPQLSKQVALKKLVRLLNELNFISSDVVGRDRLDLSQIESFNFTQLVDAYTLDEQNRLHTNIKFKVRNASNTGFSYSDNPTIQQTYQKLIECFSCKSIEQTFVINLHPVAQLFSSHFTNASSCHNMVDLRISDTAPDVSMLGGYHKGQFQMAAAGGFIVAQYDSYPDNYLCFKATDYRAQMFINPELDMIRQHLAYPGRNNDELAKSEAKTYRNIIHELLTPWHGFGTEGWLASKPNQDNDVTNSGFNWDKVLLNKRGDTFIETKDANYLGYHHESTFAFSHVIYPEPHHFVLPIVKACYPMTSHNLTINEPRSPFYSYDRTRAIASPKLFFTLQGLSSTWDSPYTHSTWALVDKPLLARDNKNRFVISQDMPHSTCNKCKTILLGIGLDLCETCVSKSSSKLFSKMVNQTQIPIYFNYKSDDDLSSFLSKVSSSSSVVWKNNDSLISFLPSGTKFLLVLKDGKLSIKVTTPKDNDNIIDVSSVVFE